MMNKFRKGVAAAGAFLALAAAGTAGAADYPMVPTPEDQKWILPKAVPAPADNATTPARAELGKMLFFDPRLSTERSMSCATCHNPLLGWSDGLPTTKGFRGKVLGRASPTVVNTGFNPIQNWDGKRDSLEGVTMGPVQNPDMMAMDGKLLSTWLAKVPGYKAAFDAAYPGEAIDKVTVAKATGAFQRTLVSDDSPFDQWLKGDKKALTPQQVKGFRLFADPAKGNCVACHQAPNFTDSGFHNLGLASFAKVPPDMGRFAIKPIPALKGAFKTPTLRDITLTAPYFHDGSASTLMEVMDHYNKGGIVKTNLSPNIKPLNLSTEEMQDIVAFMQGLTTKHKRFELPELPLE
jgi:cytochrome c peroxidase